MNPSLNRRAADADVCLLLEGTFPFVRGGVSSWVNEMLRAYPHLRFAVVFIGSREEDYRDAAYALPDNVVHFEAHYLYATAGSVDERPREVAGDPAAFAQSARLHEALRGASGAQRTGGDSVAALMAQMAPTLGAHGTLNEQQFSTSRAAWDFIVDQYERHCTDPSFTDYFWTVRIMHKPLWQLANVAEQLPPARLYHTVSTGYAGFLGTLLHYRSGRPLLVSEHGIYTKERKIDLLQSQWIRDNRGAFERDISRISYFRELWVRFFEALGRLAYEAADEIVALYEANRLRQVADGAPAAKTRSIPNGVDVDALAPLVAQRTDGPRRVVALIGRVVPIKDIKTFIRAMFVASHSRPDLEGWIVGPEEEDPAYALECRALVESLGLASRVKFLGFQRIDAVLPKIDLIALSSISEALPLVVLEGFAAGVPAITTDVGSCRQLIEGYGDEDRALGSAGAVVPIADPARFARAALALLDDDTRWRVAQQAGLARVRRYYTKAQMTDRYAALYTQLAAAPDARPAPGTGRACPAPHGAKPAGEAR
ncbi:GT4 family glycosyltransferase PelF [Burkholderia glumae]|uniref:GT4 family glycosyltransferase PelF n=1 Tax=Burkholderia glumae TaxID=337 RepID=A0AAP9Y0G2_BURGL|nr:GT4 family glycosyltransferase PelF [Burkholderia glumae]ACR30070.1 Glycosyl transferase, group 1 [Burkholderia glumae BGR1]AJY67475.1 glycosyl transferases group 1 family protein [Burkholderia glumae LMG 2196 = ATCC 33617]KHJ62279.1 glycosyl transferase family 1 [Burkholderia glumae]MCM2482286.1 GT4 family glycosyltransferase PelF [Burkholderia glumae]MCM2507571.1 GT4 family glycosyltransferase PelF [Burkholderia glumae]